MGRTLTFVVNGQERTVTTDPDRPLLEVLREDLQLTGTKYGCGEGQCGACSVLVDGHLVHSCQTSVGAVDGRTILTIEGLATGEQLHPVQEALLAEHAVQCGYCTPGMVLAVVSLLHDKPQPTDTEILTRLQGHICRCCGYPNILAAVRRAAAQAAGGTR